jgi:hypothetical protein
MIAFNNERNEITWQHSFVDMLPEIQQRLRHAFRHLDADSRDESIDEGVVHCLFTYARLHERGRTGTVTASTLAWYATLQVKRGRPAAGRMSCREPLSRYAQLGKGINVERLNAYSKKHEEWIDTLVEDKRASVVDQVAAKMDVGAWFATLSRRMKQIAKDLAFGCSTSEVARKHGVTAGRISQMRRMLEESWAAFQGEAVAAVA